MPASFQILDADNLDAVITAENFGIVRRGQSGILNFKIKNNGDTAVAGGTLSISAAGSDPMSAWAVLGSATFGALAAGATTLAIALTMTVPSTGVTSGGHAATLDVAET